MSVTTELPTPPKRTCFQSYMQTISETFFTARKSIGEYLNFVREKIPTYQTRIEHGATYFWDQLSLSSQRYVHLIGSRDAGKFVGMKASYEKNVLEDIGDWILFPMVDLPQKLHTYQNHPATLGLAYTGAALASLKFIAQPIKTTVFVGRKIAFLPRLTYFFAQAGIIGLACRSVGRMTNSSLMDHYTNKGT
jgi:hypothetical protein